MFSYKFASTWDFITLRMHCSGTEARSMTSMGHLTLWGSRMFQSDTNCPGVLPKGHGQGIPAQPALLIVYSSIPGLSLRGNQANCHFV